METYSILLLLMFIAFCFYFIIIDIVLDGPLSGILIMMSNIIILFLNWCHALNLNVVSTVRITLVTFCIYVSNKL